MKLLAFCDSPTTGSGFSRVAQNLLRRWRPEILGGLDVWGIGFVGWGYSRIKYVDTIFPGGAGGEWSAPDRLSLFIAQLQTGNYTHVWLMQDTFMLSGAKFPEVLRQVCTEKKIRSMLYFPVDAPLEPEWTDIIAAVDVAVAYTEYGKREAEAKGKLRGHNFTCEVLPHGVDTEVYKPLWDRQAIREDLWKEKWFGPDDLLMLNVNTNQRRKDVTRSLEILRGLKEKGIPAKLVMHMPERSYEGLSLELAGEQLGLKLKEDWVHHGPHFKKGNPVLAEADLVKLYNAADLYLTTTLGEGWGLGITEALACGSGVALPLHTACAEIRERCIRLNASCQNQIIGLPVEKNGVVCDMDNSRVRHRVDVEQAVQAIAASYVPFMQMPPRRALTPEVQGWLSWDRIAHDMLDWMKRAKPAQPTEANG